MSTPTPRPRKHLMTPGQPPRRTSDAMSIGAVQRWILASLAVTTILHLSAGLVFAAAYVDVQSSKIGLLVLSGAFGVIAFAAGLLIHQRQPLNPLLLLGLLPPLVGWFFVF